jgi:tetratricopeptide (TPR) repeat protein
MPRRYLFGPVSAAFAEQKLHAARREGDCLAFNAAGDTDLTVGPQDTWEQVAARLPPGWRPDFLALRLDYTTVPEGLWSAPLLLVGLAADWTLLWHHYRRCLRRCDLVLTDAPGVAALARDGLPHARAANLFGCERADLEADGPEGPRDIDVLFVGNLQPAVQRERLPWLARLAALAGRWKVVVRTGVFGPGYRALLARARVVFNRGKDGACNRRTFEAAAAGALVLQEAGNHEVPAYFADRRECVYYTEDDLEKLLDHYLSHEDERRDIAAAARARVREYSFAALWEGALGGLEADWPQVEERARHRRAPAEADRLLGRAWQAACADLGHDPLLPRDLAAGLTRHPASAAALSNALGLAAALALPRTGPAPAALVEEAAGHFHRAVAAAPDHPLANLNLAEALAALGQKDLAARGARRLLALVERAPDLDPAALDAGHFPPAFDHFRVEWERAAWANAGRPAAEARAKAELLRWRAHALLAELTGDLAHYHEAALARPDLPPTRAALGCALGRAGRPLEAVAHLRRALEGNPFDPATARALGQALSDSGDPDGARRLADARRLLHRAAPEMVPAEPWFAAPPGPRPALQEPDAPAAVAGGGRPARPRVSLCLIVKNEEHNLPACLGSAADLVDEVVVVDTGSTDATRDVARRHGARVYDFPWCDSFSAARNESLRHARGDWVFWMDADDRLDEDNRARLRRLLAALPDEHLAYSMKCLCLPDASGTATVVDHIRLFRNRPDVRWEYRVHEQILPAVRRAGGQVRWSDVVIRHTGYQDPALRGRKLQRDLRLLHLENGDRPDDPFTLFNLGSVYQELGRHAEALPLLRRSLQRSHVRDSIVRKLYSLVVGCHRALGQPEQALAACQEGLGHCPEDPELLFVEGVLLRERGELDGAASCLERLLAGRPGDHFASVDAGLRGYKGRNNLAVVYRQQGRDAEALAQWRAALAERPDFLPSWLGLAEVQLCHSRWEEVEQIARQVEALPQGAAVEAALLRARVCLARKDYAPARALLEGAIRRAPQALGPRVLLSHALLQEGRDPAAAEQALRAILELDPQHPEARHNLALLLQERERRGRGLTALPGNGDPDGG